MPSKIDAAIVILFNPNIEVLDNIASYIDHVKRLYVVDNSTHENPLMDALSINQKTKVIHSGSNIGIAVSLNLALRHAKEEHFLWIMTMDQDSFFDEEQLQNHFNDFQRITDKKTAIISPLHNPRHIQKKFQHPFIKKEYVMTSANIVNVNHALDVGGYDENLFIDEVDHAFCFTLQKSQYTILENQTVFVNHELGTPYKKNSDIKLYPPIRLYYMSRNYLYLRKKYKILHKDFFKSRDKYLIKFFIIQLIYSDQKIKSLKMILRGLSDYCYKKFGKQHED